MRRAIEGLNYLFTQSAKTLVSPIDFLDSVILLAFPDELNQLLLKVRAPVDGMLPPSLWPRGR